MGDRYPREEEEEGHDEEGEKAMHTCEHCYDTHRRAILGGRGLVFARFFPAIFRCILLRSHGHPFLALSSRSRRWQGIPMHRFDS